jgi:hypothetical protein
MHSHPRARMCWQSLALGERVSISFFEQRLEGE